LIGKGICSKRVSIDPEAIVRDCPRCDSKIYHPAWKNLVFGREIIENWKVELIFGNEVIELQVKSNPP
jgi:hypothetical protein